MEEKAQGALEYLLLIGGAVLVAAIVISIMSGLASGGTNAAESGGTTVHSRLNELNELANQ